MSLWSFLLGGGAGAVADATATVAGAFAPNAEASAQRAADARAAALGQYAAEFHDRANRTWLDSLADGLNRLVRPVVTIGLFVPVVMTIRDPAAMARVWTALATMPDGYWAVAGIVLPFYFGGRMQVKSLQAGSFRAAAAAVASLAPRPPENAALDDWRAGRGGQAGGAHT